MIKLKMSFEEIQNLAKERMCRLSEAIKAKEEKLTEVEQILKKPSRKDDEYTESMESTAEALKNQIKQRKEDLVRLKIYSEHVAPEMHFVTLSELEEANLIARRGFIK